MEFCHSYPFVTFVVLTVDQIVGHDDGPLNNNNNNNNNKRSLIPPSSQLI